LYFPTRGDPEKLLVNRHGDVLDTIGPDGTWTHRLSADGRRVALGGGGSLWLHDSERRLSTKIAVGVFPVWAPGDSAIAYSDPGQVSPLRACALRVFRIADGSDDVLMPTPVDCYRPIDWTRDGQRVLLATLPTDTLSHGEFWLYDVREKTLTSAFASTSNIAEGTVSPDGGWLAYRSEETGTWEIFVRPFKRPGAAMRVSTDGGRLPRWRADGRELFFQTPDGRIMSAAVTPGATLRIETPRALFHAAAWSRQLFFDGGTSYDVSGDGQRFVLRMTPVGNAAVLVQNWRAKLR
jgi:hypothetical protein